MPWPDISTRRIARFVFNPVIQKTTWRIMRRLLKYYPKTGLKMMLASITTLDPGKVIKKLTGEQRQKLIHLFGSLQSGEGFMNDLKRAAGTAKDVRVPTLIVHVKRVWELLARDYTSSTKN